MPNATLFVASQSSFTVLVHTLMVIVAKWCRFRLQRFSCVLDSEQCTAKIVSHDRLHCKDCDLWCRLSRTVYCKGCVLWCLADLWLSLQIYNSMKSFGIMWLGCEWCKKENHPSLKGWAWSLWGVFWVLNKKPRWWSCPCGCFPVISQGRW